MGGEGAGGCGHALAAFKLLFMPRDRVTRRLEEMTRSAIKSKPISVRAPAAIFVGFLTAPVISRKGTVPFVL